MPNPGRGGPVRHVGARLETVVLVCRKCSKKLDGGFGADGGERLAKALRRRIAGEGRVRKPLRSRTAVLEVGCLDLCPKGAVVALRAGRPGDWVVVPKGADLGEVMAELGLPDPGPENP